MEDFCKEFEEYDSHYLIWLDRLSDQLRSVDGFLNDTARSKEFGIYRDALRWSPNKGFSEDQEIWLNIDFDFAVHWLNNGYNNGFSDMPWREEDFKKEFNTEMASENYVFKTSSDFLSEVIRKSKLITFATEPNHSCNIEGVYQIGVMLEKIFSYAGIRIKIVSENICSS